ncbi:MAG: flavodoxin family protein [Pseudomonadales bacterium]|jgi:multimeric flavodoxin WrbA|nr:flavodoxin family protein [Pseudomonadales bacterium]
MRSTISLFGSSRRNGNTGKLIDVVASNLGIEVVDLSGKNISAFDYEHRNRSDDFEPLMERILGYEQIILASPVYWYAASPPMKIFLDRISDYLDLPDLLEKGRKLRGKRGYVVCTSVFDEVSPTFISAFRETFEYLGMTFGGFLHVNCKENFNATNHKNDIDAFVALIKEDAGHREARSFFLTERR